jgi:hypothetical protein
MKAVMNEPARLIETDDAAGALLRESLVDYAAGLDGQRAWARVQARQPRPARWPWQVLVVASVCAAGIAVAVGTGREERPATASVAAPAAPAGGPIIVPLEAEAPADKDEGTQEAAARPEARHRHRAAHALAVRMQPQALEAGQELTLADDGTRVHLAAGGLAAVSVPERGRTVVTLSRGKVGATVTRRRPGEHFEVQAGPYTFRVVGTSFTVELARGQARLAVAEGVVAVNAGERELERITAGGSWSSGTVTPPAAVEPEPAPETPPAAEPAAIEAPRPVPPPVRAVEAAPEPARAVVPPRGLPAPPREAPPARTPASGECLARARAGATSQAAAECLAAAAGKRGLDAEIALVELARLRRDALNDPKGALAALAEYRARFPMGSLYEEALGASVDLLIRAGDGPAALAESERLLRRVGTDQRRAELHLLRGNVLRVLEADCRRADAEYAAAASGAPRVADDAAYWRAVCLASAGERAAAARAFARYLERPKAQHASEARARLEGLRR